MLKGARLTDSLLVDPDRLEDYKQKYRERNRQNRSHPVSEEETQHRRELGHLRQQKCRERKRAERLASEAGLSHQQPVQKMSTRKSQKEYEAVVEAKRAQWRAQQQNRRANWNAQKRRRHREKSLACYHENKKLERSTDGIKTDKPSASQTPEHPASQQEGATEPGPASQQEEATESAPASQQEEATEHPPAPLPQQSPSCGPQPGSSSTISPGDRKAVYRAKKAIMNSKPHLFAPLMMRIQAQKSPRKQKALDEIAGSPTAKKIKERCMQKIHALHGKRSTAALSAWKTAFETVTEVDLPSSGTYNKTSKKAIAIQEFLEGVAVCMPGKSATKKGVAKKLLPKRVKRLHRDFVASANLKVSLATFYRHIPKHIVTSAKQRKDIVVKEEDIGELVEETIQDLIPFSWHMFVAQVAMNASGCCTAGNPGKTLSGCCHMRLC